MARKTFFKVITSPELIEKINPENKKLVEKFLKEKATRSSDTTIYNYRSDLNIFFVYNLLHNDNKFFIDIKKIEFSDFFSYVVDELKWGSARFGRMRACLSSFSNFIEKFFDESYPAFRNVILKVVENMPKSYAREKTILTEDQVNSLLEHLSKNDPQEACFVALAICSGARLSELLRFTTDIIDPENTAFEGMFIETTKDIKTKGRSRTGKLMKKYILKSVFMPYYEAWLPEREKILEEKSKIHDSIFITREGNPAAVTTVRNWIKDWEKFLGITVYPHSFRHYIVTQLTRMGINSDLIVELMGWTSGEMYKLYLDLTAKDREWKGLDKLTNLSVK